MDFSAWPDVEALNNWDTRKLSTVIGPFAATTSAGGTQPQYQVDNLKVVSCGCPPCRRPMGGNCLVQKRDPTFKSLVSPKSHLTPRYWIGEKPMQYKDLQRAIRELKRGPLSCSKLTSHVSQRIKKLPAYEECLNEYLIS